MKKAHGCIDPGLEFYQVDEAKGQRVKDSRDLDDSVVKKKKGLWHPVSIEKRVKRE